MRGTHKEETNCISQPRCCLVRESKTTTTAFELRPYAPVDLSRAEQYFYPLSLSPFALRFVFFFFSGGKRDEG